MGLLDSLAIGRKALSAASGGIHVTSQNVANVATPGYSRRSLKTQTADPVEQRGVWFGQGVDITGIARSHDRYLGMRIVEVAGQQSRSQTAEESLKLTESYFNETDTTGLVEVYGSFFDAFTQLTSDPSDVSLRQAAVQAADTLATTVSRVANGLNDTITSLDNNFANKFNGLNSSLQEIARLNAAIGKAEGDIYGNGDLLDRRDQLIRDMASAMGATTELEPDGQATVFVDGQAVVSGSIARSLSLVTAVGSAPQLLVAVDGGSIDVTTGLGGQLGGLLDARNFTNGYLNRLDDFAFTFEFLIRIITKVLKGKTHYSI